MVAVAANAAPKGTSGGGKEGKNSAPTNREPVPEHSSSPQMDALYASGEKAYLEQRYGEAASYLQTIISSDPGYARAHNLLGRIYHKQGKLDLALGEYRKSMDCDPRFVEARYNTGVAFFDQGNYKEAERFLDEAVAKEPRNAEYQYNLALSAEKLGKKDKALDCLQKAVKLGPNNAVAHYCLGRIYQEMGQSEKAMEEAKAAIAINPDFVEAHNNLGVAYGALGKMTESIEEFQKALKCDPNYPEAQRNLGYAQAHTSLGITYYNQGKPFLLVKGGLANSRITLVAGTSKGIGTIESDKSFLPVPVFDPVVVQTARCDPMGEYTFALPLRMPNDKSADATKVDSTLAAQNGKIYVAAIIQAPRGISAKRTLISYPLAIDR